MKLSLSMIFLLFVILQANCQLYDWRGPDRTGVYNESGLLKQWTEAGPALVWEADGLGYGFSSVTISDDAIYITGRMDTDDVLTALNFDGTKKWQITYGEAWTRNHDGSRCTLTFYNGHIFLISGSGDIVCVDSNGKIKWSKNHYQLYGSSPVMFGISESPLIVDDKVIASPGGKKASLVAFNIENGDIIWEAEPLNEEPQYVNPKLVQYGGRKIIVTNTSRYIIGVDARDGKLLWKINYSAINAGSGRDRGNHATTPLHRDGLILIANGYDFVALQLKLSKDGSDAEVVWENRDLDPHHGGLVLLGDYIYGSNMKSTSMGDWICVNWNTGKTEWTSRWYNKGSIIYADGMLYLFEEKSGHVALVKPDPEKFDIVSEFRITKGDGPYWAHPVIRDGRLYIRHGGVLLVYSLK
ncbi:MAG: PQQ-binding-like beta-propeller repeat protein [Bacteroidetes bacterium]|nr:PQQ-binding-like beta-propeller repeat protein [Bacteroidota bacterium]